MAVICLVIFFPTLVLVSHFTLISPHLGPHKVFVTKKTIKNKLVPHKSRGGDGRKFEANGNSVLSTNLALKKEKYLFI